jgi:hypothetical protein
MGGGRPADTAEKEAGLKTPPTPPFTTIIADSAAPKTMEVKASGSPKKAARFPD